MMSVVGFIDVSAKMNWQNCITFQVKQGNLSDNSRMHTLRGFHYQQVPTQEAKLLACVTGAIYNVVLDLRKKSKTYQQWEGIEISAEKRQTIHVPAGCANAFLTLEDNTIVHYYMSEFFVPETYQGIRYNDPSSGWNGLLSRR